jgi:hypothetical protein
MFGKNWEPATATIVAKKMKHHSSSPQSHPTFIFVADVTPASGPPFRTELEQQLLSMSGVPLLSEYDVVKVLVDVKNKKAKFDTSDPKVSGKKQSSASDKFDAALAEPPLSPPPSDPAD